MLHNAAVKMSVHMPNSLISEHVIVWQSA